LEIDEGRGELGSVVLETKNERKKKYTENEERRNGIEEMI
jgi:hypothetical protein